MDPLNWARNAVDKIFFTRRTSPGEPKCPDGTYLSGYTRDPWGKWQVMCMSMLEVEDVEDVFIFVAIGFMIFITFFGMGGLLWKIRRLKEHIVHMGDSFKQARHPRVTNAPNHRGNNTTYRGNNHRDNARRSDEDSQV